jgi:hypothetical protein
MICYQCHKEYNKLNKKNFCKDCSKIIRNIEKDLDYEFIADFNLNCCSKCNKNKNRNSFYKNNLSICKDCKKEINKKNRFENYKSYLLSVAKQRAKYKNLEFNINENDFYIPSICPILKINLSLIGNIDSRPTIDRIDNSKGYIKNNIRIISFRANRIKNDSTKKELEAIYNS